MGVQGVSILRRSSALVAVAGVITTFNNVQGNGWHAINFSGLLATAVGALAYGLMVRGHFRPAMHTLIWGAGLLIIGYSFAIAGIRTPALVFIPILCMAAAWLLGLRSAIALGICALAAFVFYAVAEQFGYIPPMTARNSLSYTLIYGFTLVSAAIVAVGSTRSFQIQLQRTLDLSQDLELRVAARTAELTQTVQELKATQNELVEVEKLASLGAMVAGISHELNTPIGVAVTAASTLHGHTMELQQLIAKDQLRRSVLTQSLRKQEEMSLLILRSTERAAELISSFKQVAVDRASERRRVFVLYSLVHDIIASLQADLRKSQVTVVQDVVPDIRCDSLPGPVGQVLTNLLQNAMLHAFIDRGAGTIRITATLEGSEGHAQVVLRVQDDGVGMSEHTRHHAFDPFFTTRLGHGGSGLGLSVSHRLATSMLGGSLSVESAPGTGSCFTFCFPQQLKA